jgi:MerR family redox-sensitive transcriptional activator SoxR
MPELTITAIARKAGVRPSTLRYYEKIGLLPLARRVAGRRRYDVCVEAIGAHRLRQTGGLQSGQNPGPPGRCLQREAALLWRDLAKEKVAELDQVIVRAQEAKRRLVVLSRCRCRNLAECGDRLRNEAENVNLA